MTDGNVGTGGLDGLEPREERESDASERTAASRTGDAAPEPVQSREVTICSACDQPAVARQTLFEHKPCGHIGQREAFASSGEIECRGCDRLKNDESVVAVGVIYRCENCGQVYDRPVHEVTNEQ